MSARIRSLPLAPAVLLAGAFTVVFAVVTIWAALRYSVPMAVRTRSGSWQIVDSPDWVPAVLAGVLVGLAVAALLNAVMRQLRGRGRVAPWYLAALLAFTASVGASVMLPISVSIMCDGSVPTWMLPKDYNGGGCVMYPVNWEQTLPWDDEELHCLGMCVSF